MSDAEMVVTADELAEAAVWCECGGAGVCVCFADELAGLTEWAEQNQPSD